VTDELNVTSAVTAVTAVPLVKAKVSLDSNSENTDADAGSDSDADAAGIAAIDALDSDLKEIFVDEYSNHIALLDNNFNKLSFELDDESNLKKTVNEVEDCIHTLAGNCRNLGFDEAAVCAEGNLPLIEKISASGGAPNAAIASMLDQSLSLLKESRDQIKLSGHYDDDLKKQFGEQTESSRLVALAGPDSEEHLSSDKGSVDQAPEALDQESERADPEPAESGQTERSNSTQSDVADTVSVPSNPQQHSQSPQLSEETTISPESVSSVDEEPSEMEEDIDEEIREIFLEESETVLGRINGHLMEWRDDGANSTALGGIRREFHTLKGSAAATGYTGISGLSHSIESMLDDIRPDQDVSGTGLLELLEEMHDGLAADLGFVPTDKKGHIAELRRKVARHLGEDDGLDDPAESSIPVSAEEVASSHDASFEVVETEPDPTTVVEEEQPQKTFPQAQATKESESIAEEPAEEPLDASQQDDTLEEIESQSELVKTVTKPRPLDPIPQDEEFEEVETVSESAETVSETPSLDAGPQDEEFEEVETASESTDTVPETPSLNASSEDAVSEEVETESESADTVPETPSLDASADDAVSEEVETASESADTVPETPSLAASSQDESTKEVEIEPQATEKVGDKPALDARQESEVFEEVRPEPELPTAASPVSKVFESAAMMTTNNLSIQPVPTEPKSYAMPELSRPPVKVVGEQIDLKYGGERMSWTPSSSLFLDGELSEEEASSGSLRIASEKLAELINASGELGLGRNQLQNTLEATRMDLDLLRASMSTMREGLRDIEIEAEAQIRARPEQQTVAVDEEFDPLQLDRYSKLQAKSREVTELLDQLAKVERGLGNRASNLTGTLQQQQHLGQQLQSGLMSARMVTAGDYVPRLRYLVRESARQASKKVQLEFIGGEINIDRQVIESMMAPFEHMIRNAIAHGIELPAERVSAGKPEQGVIKIELSQQGTELVVIVSDDGSGLDVEKLALKAVELGLVNNVANISEVDMLQVVAQPGFSTAEKVSMESGRGVGMDVVYQAVRDLSGSMGLNNIPGKGVTFSFRLPVTLAVTQALLVKVGQWQFALRSRTVYRLVRVNEDEVIHDEGSRFMMLEGEKIPLISLRRRLGDNLATTTK